MIATTLALAAGAFQAAPCTMDLPENFEQQHHVQCGWVTVPLRHGTTGGKSTRLWTARIGALGADTHDDPILYINGGPGIATVETIVPAIVDSKSLAMLRQGRDLIVFDQRGSGRSEQALCPTLAKRLDTIESSGLAPDVEAERSRAAFAECRMELDSTGVDLASYTTHATVLDMEVLREAFQVRRWNLVSISYGGLIAMDAMRSSPGSVRSVILNSPYPPNSVTWAEQSTSAAAAYAAIDSQCSAMPGCSSRFGALLPKLKAMVAKYASGESFGGYSPAQAMAISCYESGRTVEWNARARALHPGLASADPDDSWDRLCTDFRPGFADPAFFAPVASDIPTLIYAGALDPATPTVDAYQAMRLLKHATLVEVADASHGPMGVDDCTRRIAAAFLADPSRTPDRGCITGRKPIEFASEGLEALLAPH